eukprot:CAMPEP_0172322024 /NCGR_PEP_ID=MMETSP1058-20130122/44818_1 /TAXON_ID=83371 /ORGANISM="Detonula confervacea, Strain CCMP 353" /LENGTH=488 /DNA_ID=CAMNT_0013037657 /DNA_START=169 /DNA_END=1631 /DNA_ORIENTATION=-
MRHSQTQRPTRPTQQPRHNRPKAQPRPQQHQKNAQKPQPPSKNQHQLDQLRRRKLNQQANKEQHRSKRSTHRLERGCGNKVRAPRKPLEPEEEGVVKIQRRGYPSAPSSANDVNKRSRAGKQRNNLHASLPPQPQPQYRNRQRNDLSSSLPPVSNRHHSSSSGSESSATDNIRGDISSDESSIDEASSSARTHHYAKEVCKTVDSTSKTNHETHPKSYSAKPSSATIPTDASAVFEQIAREHHANHTLGRFPSYKDLLTMMESRQHTDCGSPVRSYDSGKHRGMGVEKKNNDEDKYAADDIESMSKQVTRDRKLSWNTSGSFTDEGGSTYSGQPSENESGNSNDENLSDDTFDSMYSESPTEHNIESITSRAFAQSHPLPSSADNDLVQKQIQYLQHSQPQMNNDVDQKLQTNSLQKKQPQIEYITDQLDQIKKRREIIHKRVGDEVAVGHEKRSDWRSFNGSTQTEESLDRSHCLDTSGVQNNNSSL